MLPKFLEIYPSYIYQLFPTSLFLIYSKKSKSLTVEFIGTNVDLIRIPKILHIK